jgi:hypothetical protein
MLTLQIRWLAAVVLLSLAGCAAMITKSGSGELDLIQAGTTEVQLTQRLGSPIRSRLLTPPRQTWELWENDKQVFLLKSQEIAYSESVFSAKGRLNKSGRVAQTGFDSFMTLGLAEIYLIPKALWERAIDEDLQLTVWFDTEGRALAYKWATLSTQ